MSSRPAFAMDTNASADRAAANRPSHCASTASGGAGRADLGRWTEDRRRGSRHGGGHRRPCKQPLDLLPELSILMAQSAAHLSQLAHLRRQHVQRSVVMHVYCGTPFGLSQKGSRTLPTAKRRNSDIEPFHLRPLPSSPRAWLTREIPPVTRQGRVRWPYPAGLGPERSRRGESRRGNAVKPVTG
jgi:hypothetical protein